MIKYCYLKLSHTFTKIYVNTNKVKDGSRFGCVAIIIAYDIKVFTHNIIIITKR